MVTVDQLNFSHWNLMLMEVLYKYSSLILMCKFGWKLC